ncbi:uncharacterized protein BJX67DRAFT_323232 [Aspergillus lucknowensis]|uniref:Uncharacterized protein n=1 Tax=Aspergillus lucknowensis TaxID=176173 RepID=A0ABR4LZ85_9EURO
MKCWKGQQRTPGFNKCRGKPRPSAGWKELVRLNGRHSAGNNLETMCKAQGTSRRRKGQFKSKPDPPVRAFDAHPLATSRSWNRRHLTFLEIVVDANHVILTIVLLFGALDPFVFQMWFSKTTFDRSSIYRRRPRSSRQSLTEWDQEWMSWRSDSNRLESQNHFGSSHWCFLMGNPDAGDPPRMPCLSGGVMIARQQAVPGFPTHPERSRWNGMACERISGHDLRQLGAHVALVRSPRWSPYKNRPEHMRNPSFESGAGRN